VKLLVDECLHPTVAMLLTGAGHDAVHIVDLGLRAALDATIMQAAVDSGRVLISADTDFGELLAASGAMLPSVVLLRRHGHDPSEQVDAILGAIEAVGDDLDAGAVVVISDTRLRVRTLPIGHDREV
jgi:predicted nuclease of predicted toxin-antitoxin system